MTKQEQGKVRFSRRRFLSLPAGALLSAGVFAAPSRLKAFTGPGLPVPLQDMAGDWRLTFEDDFNDPVAFNRDWQRMRKGGHFHKTMRLPENVVVEGGAVHLRLGHQDDPKRPFTGGFVQTRTFRQRYGYFECEMKIPSEAGINNAFWLVSDRETEGDIRFELDVAEVKYPNTVLFAARRWRPGNGKKVLRGKHKAHVRLDEAYHRYAMLWTKEYFRFYVDDFELFQGPNEFSHTPALLLLSNAVAPFAGQNDGDVAGAATSVRNLRVFQDVSA